ncbi:unnamed protein product [Phaeothamnion confervicola]
MCRKVTCSKCGKPSWAGCGQHIESALSGVAEADRCPGWRSGKCTAAGGGDAGAKTGAKCGPS